MEEIEELQAVEQNLIQIETQAKARLEEIGSERSAKATELESQNNNL